MHTLKNVLYNFDAMFGRGFVTILIFLVETLNLKQPKPLTLILFSKIHSPNITKAASGKTSFVLNNTKSVLRIFTKAVYDNNLKQVKS